MYLPTSLIITFLGTVLSLKMIVVPPIIIQSYDRTPWYVTSSHFISALSPFYLQIPLISPTETTETTQTSETTQAEHETSANDAPKDVFNPPEDDAPDDTRGAGSRDTGHCVDDEPMATETAFQVFMPVYTEISDERPIFSVYIPPTTATKLFFSLKDAEESYYYETTISLPTNPGKFNFELPNEAPVIETNKEYKWSLALVCDRTLSANNPMVQGIIRKVAIN